MRTCRHCSGKFDPDDLNLLGCLKREPQGPCEPIPRGFAALSKEQILEISSKGGKAAHALGSAHRFSAEEASEAGRLGGNAPHARRGPVRKSEG